MSEIICIIETTLEQADTADKLATEAVAAGVVACAQVAGPVTSHYTWQGKVEQTQEYCIQFKLSLKNREAFTRWLMDRHPYKCPQVLAWNAESNNPEYTSWVNGK